METCEYCGLDDCNGILTLGTNPYKVEIEEDYTESWMCRGKRQICAEDI